MIKYFGTQRQAETALKRLRGTKTMKWTVQGNALVKIRRRKI